MKAMIPAFSDLSGHQEVIVFEETDGGSFRKTSKHPLGLLEKHIEGLGSRIGQLIPYEYDHDRDEHEWSTPTVRCESTGKEYSYYQYLRETLKQKKMVIVSVPSSHGVIHKFDMYELVFTHDTSPGIQSRIMAKYAESAEVKFKDDETPTFMYA